MTRRWLPAALAAAIFGLVGKAQAQHDLATLPLHDPAYVQLASLERTGCLPARVSPFRPYQTGAIRRALVAAGTDVGCIGPVLTSLVQRFGADTINADTSGFTAGGAAELRATSSGDAEFQPLWRDLRDASEGDPTVVGLLRGRLTWRGGPRLVAVTEAFAQTSGRNDPRVRGRGVRETEAVLDFSEAYISGRIGPLTASFGRAAEAWWGEGDESLILSAHGPALDRIMLSAGGRRWEARAILGSIDAVVVSPEQDRLAPGVQAQRFRRMIVGHALTLRPTSGLELSIGETALLTRRGGGVDLAFVNPLMIFLVTENDQARTGLGADENNLGVFGAVRARRGGLMAGAELFVDDIQIDAADRRNIPDQLAWRFEAGYGTVLVHPASVRLQYRRNDSFVYLRSPYSLVYQQYDQPLGSELGPDADLLRAVGEFWVSGDVMLGGSAGRWRRGANRIDERPSPSPQGRANEPYPSVRAGRSANQSGWLGDISVHRTHPRFPIQVRTELARLESVNNQPVPPANYLRLHVVGSFRFRYP